MGVTILTVDDSKMIRTLVGRALRNYDVRLLEAEDGEKGLAAAQSERPDMILLDVAMPVMDGIETLGKLKRDPATTPIPVIMLTAEASKEKVMEIIRGGADYYLLKPFKPDALVRSIVKKLTLPPRRSPARKYFAAENGVGVMTLPPSVSRALLAEILPELPEELARIRNDGHEGLIIDMAGTERVDIPVARLITEVMRRCREIDISVSVAGDPEAAQGLRAFEEGRDIPVHFSMSKARTALGVPGS
jgi:CheY-like chemotaxis protein